MRIGTLQGIPIHLHSTFFLITGFYFISTLVSSGLSAAINSGLIILLLFGSVFLHEMGHAMVARRYGIGTRNITLHLLGGFASIEREPRIPRQEVAIALAGILAFRHPDVERIQRTLHDQDIHVMFHAGRIRVAIHGYNTMDDVERFLAALQAAL